MINQEQLMLWTLILTRCTGVILLNPILGRRNLPGIVRAGFIMALTLLVFNFQPQQLSEQQLRIDSVFFFVCHFRKLIVCFQNPCGNVLYIFP